MMVQAFFKCCKLAKCPLRENRWKDCFLSNRQDRLDFNNRITVRYKQICLVAIYMMLRVNFFPVSKEGKSPRVNAGADCMIRNRWT